MAWASSKIFTAFIETAMESANINTSSDTFKAALYNNTTAPDNTVTAANSAYAVDQWVVANEVDDGTNWDTGGEPLVSVTSSFTGTTYTFDAQDTVQGGATTTLANVYGCLVYSDTATVVADQGVCYNYFSGPQSVTGGTFTIVWNGSGIFTISVA